MAIRTTRIKAPQAPELRTFNISNQVDGVRTAFNLPFTANNQTNVDYILVDGKMFRNDAHREYFTISRDGKQLITRFTVAAGSTLQIIATDNSAGAESATIRDVEEAKEEAIETSKTYTDEEIATEKEARESKDSELEAMITTEQTERAEADDVLKGRIDANDEAIETLNGSVEELDGKITEEANTRAEQDGILGQSIADETTAREAADNAIEDKLDRNVVTDIAIDSTTSTAVVKLNETKTNLKTGIVSPEEVVFPVADDTKAGVMSSSTYNSVQENAENIDTLLHGAVMTTLLTLNPTQEQILAAWQMSSGKTTPVNSASVWDSNNHKRYVYYSSQSQWVLTQEGLGGEGVTVSPWSNTSAGIVKGSTNAGQIFAESDGTGSVNGWDQLRSDSTVALEKATINETTIAGKQDKLTAGDGIKIENNVISNTQTSAEWGNITGNLADQEDLKAALDSKADAGEGSVDTNMIEDGAVTTEKLDFTYINSIERQRSYLYKISFNLIPEDDGTDSAFASCSSHVKDGKLFRNLDWNYDETISFHVKAEGFEGMAFVDGLTEGNLDVKKMEQLPYHMVDGINEHGIMMAVHVLYNDWNWTKASANADTPLNVVGLRVLQEVVSMDTMERDLGSLLNRVKATDGMLASGYILQFIVTDGTTTKIITPPDADNEHYTIVDATANPKLTNFKWVEDTTVERANLQTRPTGVERWNMLPLGMRELRFTKAYEAPDRLSEFIGINDTTKDSSDEVLTGIYNSAKTLYDRHIRDGQTWQTMHSVVYSKRGMEELYVQENWDRDYSEPNVAAIYSGIDEPTNDLGKDGDIYVMYTEE